jgi:hypothetical protein
VRFLAPIVLFAPLLLGCPNTDAAVFVDPSIVSPSLTAGKSVLQSGITGGGFTLELHLGPRASGPSTVTLGEFSVMDAHEMNTFVPALKVQDTDSAWATGKATVQLDSTLTTAFTLPMQTVDITQICSAGMVVIAGTIDDSLQGRQEPVYSAPFPPTCK